MQRLLEIISSISPYTGKNRVLFNLQNWSLPRVGKIIPKTFLTRRPFHWPTSRNMKVNMIDRLSPVWAFVHYHLITLLQGQISSTFLAKDHQLSKKTFVIILCYRNLGYMLLGYHQKMCWCLRGNVMKSKTLVILKNDRGWISFLPEDHVTTRPSSLSFGDLTCHRGLPSSRLPGAAFIFLKNLYFYFWVLFSILFFRAS